MIRLVMQIIALLAAWLVATPVLAEADVKDLIKCQSRIALAGAKYASTVISKTLACTNAVVECQVNCENGVYGQPCDPEDRNSNSEFGECMDEADETCAAEQEKIDAAEVKKRLKITVACGALSTEQLCGANTPGLNFESLAAGCQALIPGWTCSLGGILDCVAGPMQETLGEQMAALLDPRAGEALPVAGVTSVRGIAQTVKVTEALPAGKVDVWAIDGIVDDEIKVRVKGVDQGAGLSGLQPRLTYVSNDGSTPVADTAVVATSCGVPSVCGQPCASFKRRFPFSGTFYLTVESDVSNGCGGGAYRLLVTTPGGTQPQLVANDVNP